MNCEHFLERYSDYIDGILDETAATECTEHQDTCPTCGRYAHVMNEGVDLFRSLPEAEPASDFAPRLRHRLYHVEDNIPWAAAHPGGSAAILAVAAVGFLSLFWLPFAAQIPVEVEFAPVAVDAPESTTVPALYQNTRFFGEPSEPLIPRAGTTTLAVRTYLQGVRSSSLVSTSDSAGSAP